MTGSADSCNRLLVPVGPYVDARVRFSHFVTPSAVAANGWWEVRESLIHDPYRVEVLLVPHAFETVQFEHEGFTVRAAVLAHVICHPPDLIAAIA